MVVRTILGAGFLAAALIALGPRASAKAVTVNPPSEPVACGTNGTFHAVGNMNTGRTFAAAALLDDGKVLVAGGDSFTRSAQLFDPVSETFSNTGSLNVGRCYGCGVAKLQDGRVLVAGGWAGGPVLTSAEIYDPSTHAFSLVSGTMGTARLGPNVHRLNDGNVFIAFGHGGFSPAPTAELFDPTSGTFTATGSPSISRLPTSVKLADGRILLVGGQDNSAAYISLGEIYDPAVGQFSVTASMTVPRHAPEAILLPDGKVLVTGGLTKDSVGVLNTAEIYDPVSESFTATGSMASRRVNHRMVPTADGKVLVIGGADASFAPIASTEVYDPVTGVFSPGPALSQPRAAASVVVLGTGGVLVAGGNSTGGKPPTAEVYSCPTQDTTPPEVTCGTADGLWHGSDVSIACSAVDTDSGLANAADASFYLYTNVASGSETDNAATGSRTVCDNAGNCTTVGPIAGNKIDRKAPDITVAAPTAMTYLLGQPVMANYGCIDAGSGVGSCSGSLAVGASLDTSTVGSRSFVVTALDAAGNSSTRTVNYEVSYRVCVQFDQSKAYKSGSTVPIKLQLCDAGGNNRSMAATTLTAMSAWMVSNMAPGPLDDSGQANPDLQFRLAGDSYIFNLSLKGYATGTYVLGFTASGDSTQHTVMFQVK